jgi:hypothetical protein
MKIASSFFQEIPKPEVHVILENNFRTATGSSVILKKN